ncbi:MAG: hypothetical protein WC877_02045 [Dehalococcoidales bacterium]|jgi:hypothetical protein
MFEFLKKKTVVRKSRSSWMISTDLEWVMDRLIFNDKCYKSICDEHWYNDEVIAFECRPHCSNSYVTIFDATDCKYGMLVTFFQVANPTWYIESEVCRQKLINRLNGIIEMAEQLPSRESEFCKRL